MHNRFNRAAIAAALVACTAQHASAQIVDQSNYAFQGLFSSAFTWSGQTFRPTASSSVGAGFNIFAYNGYDDGTAIGSLTIELWTDIPSNVGASMVASGLSAFSIAPNQQAMVDVFWSAVAVNPGTQYFLAVKASSAAGTPYLTYSPGTDYANGGVYTNNSSNHAAAYDASLKDRYDLTFEEYSAAPEPATIVLLATGMALTLGVARRPRR